MERTTTKILRESDYIVAIGPFRVLKQAVKSKHFSYCKFPDANLPRVNRKAVIQADILIAFVDEDFFIKGNSIGTKIEVSHNMHKLALAYMNTGHMFDLIPLGAVIETSLHEELPTWDDYVKGVENDL